MRRFASIALALAVSVGGCKKASTSAVEDKHATCDRFAHRAMGSTATALVLALGNDAKTADCMKAHPSAVTQCMSPSEAKDFEKKTAELTAECEGWSQETVACIRDDSTTSQCVALLEKAMGHADEATNASAPNGPPVAWTIALSAKPMDVRPIDDAVVAVLRDGVIAVGRADGKTRWTFPFPQELSSLTESWVVALGKGLALVGDGHGAAIALDLATGKEAWRVAASLDPDEPYDPILAASVVSEGKVRLLMEKGAIVTLARDECGAAKKLGKKCVQPWGKIPMISVGQMVVDPGDGRTWIHGNEDVYVLSPDGALEAQFRTGETGGIGDLGVLHGGTVGFVVDDARLVVASAARCKVAANAIVALSPKAAADEDESIVPAPEGCIVATKTVPYAVADAPRPLDGNGILVGGDDDRVVRFDDGAKETWRAGEGAIHFDADPQSGEVFLFAARADAPSVLEGYDRDGKIRWRTDLGFGNGDRNDSFLVRDGQDCFVADAGHLARVGK